MEFIANGISFIFIVAAVSVLVVLPIIWTLFSLRVVKKSTSKLFKKA